MPSSEDATDYAVDYVSDTYPFSYPASNKFEAKGFRAWTSGRSGQQIIEFDEHLEAAQSRLKIFAPPQPLCPAPPGFYTPSVSERFWWPMAAEPSEGLVDSYIGVYAMNRDTMLAFRKDLARSIADWQSRQAGASGDSRTEKKGTVGSGVTMFNTVASTQAETRRELGGTTMDDIGKETDKWSTEEIEEISKRRRQGELAIWEETCMGGIMEEGYDSQSTIFGGETMEIRVKFPLSSGTSVGSFTGKSI
jgi:hypothetical protein